MLRGAFSKPCPFHSPPPTPPETGEVSFEKSLLDFHYVRHSRRELHQLQTGIAASEAWKEDVEPNAIPTGGLPDFGQAMEGMKDSPERKLYIKCR